MSRAFVKESDDVPELPDRPVSEHPNLVTKKGLAQIEAEIAVHRAALAEAQANEDRAAIAAASRELRYWNARRASAELQPPASDCDSVHFGCRVTLHRDPPPRKGKATVAYTIVGEDEADPTRGTLSYVSPLARALMGKEVGDVVPMGEGEAEVLKIEAGTR
jgi:transcription elongation GreA/GreB family factor